MSTKWMGNEDNENNDKREEILSQKWYKDPPLGEEKSSLKKTTEKMEKIRGVAERFI